MAEGQLAMQQSHNLAVRELGRWMDTDHGQIGQYLDSIARCDGMMVLTEMSQMQRNQYTRLQGLKGAPIRPAVYSGPGERP